MQMYMGLSGDKWGSKYRIERALYMAVNKNNDDLYCERIRFDKEYYEAMLKRAGEIIFTDKAPEGLPNASPSWYECKFCDYYSLCHEQKFPEVNCRTCAFSTPSEYGGKWLCTNQWHENDTNVVLSEADQKKGCGNHLINPTLIDTWATAIDGTDESIVFERKDNQETFVNGFGHGYISSQRLFEENQ